jgi:hypothetical protein
VGAPPCEPRVDPVRGLVGWGDGVSAGRSGDRRLPALREPPIMPSGRQDSTCAPLTPGRARLAQCRAPQLLHPCRSMPSQTGALATRTPLLRLRQLLAGWTLGYNVPHTATPTPATRSGWIRSCAQPGPAGDDMGAACRIAGENAVQLTPTRTRGCTRGGRARVAAVTAMISHTTFDARDAYAQSVFWCRVSGVRRAPGRPEPARPRGVHDLLAGRPPTVALHRGAGGQAGQDRVAAGHRRRAPRSGSALGVGVKGAAAPVPRATPATSRFPSSRSSRRWASPSCLGRWRASP